MSEGPTVRRWRKRVRFSIRALLVVVLVIAAGLGWLVRGARIQREAVAAINRARGSVKYDWEQHAGPGKPRAPKWLEDLLGVDYFEHVTEVELSPSSKSTHDVLLQVENLHQLDRLNLDGTSVSDSDLAILKRLGNLSYLSLYLTKVSDAGLAQLKGLTALASLDLHGTKITDLALAHIKGMTSLRMLRLHRTQVTDAGINELERALPSLTIVR
jgi:hypothetical protein